MKKKKTFFLAFIMLISILTCSLASAGVISGTTKVARPLETTCLYSEKSETSDIVCLLYDDYNYEVSYVIDDWARVVVCGDVSGYVRKDDIILIEGVEPSSDITYYLSSVASVVEVTAENIEKQAASDAKVKALETEQQEIIETIADYVEEVDGYYDITTTVADEVNTINTNYEIASTGNITNARTALTRSETALEEAAEKAENVEELRNSIVSYATSYVGILPYVWGGTSLVTGADCSGFTQSIYKHFGYSISRTSYAQRSSGVSVSYSDLKPGDILCFSGHVGIYIGNDKFVHSPSTGQYVKISTLSAFPKKIIAIRRIVV